MIGLLLKTAVTVAAFKPIQSFMKNVLPKTDGPAL